LREPRRNAQPIRDVLDAFQLRLVTGDARV
jgi:hypothetical protein